MPIIPINQSKSSISSTNQTKTLAASYFELQNAVLFLLQNGNNLEMQGGVATTFVNILKNAISPINRSRQGFFLLMEDGFYLLQETGYKMILDVPSFGFSGTNISKNSISPTNQTKS